MKKIELLSDKYYKRLKRKNPGWDLYNQYQYSKYMEVLHTIGLTDYCGIKDNLNAITVPYYFDPNVSFNLWYWYIIIIPVDNKKYNAYVFQRNCTNGLVDIYYYELTRRYGYFYDSQLLISKTDFEFDFSMRYIGILQSKSNAEIFKYSYAMAYPIVCHNSVYELSRVKKMDDEIDSLARARDGFLESYSKFLENQRSMEKRFKDCHISIEDLKL